MITTSQAIVIIIICALCTFLERALPFILFKNKTPKIVHYLGQVLPMAIMATLIIYCLKDIPTSSSNYTIVQLVSCAVTIALHLWRRNTLLSIFGGTACCMLLSQVFL